MEQFTSASASAASSPDSDPKRISYENVPAVMLFSIFIAVSSLVGVKGATALRNLDGTYNVRAFRTQAEFDACAAYFPLNFFDYNDVLNSFDIKGKPSVASKIADALFEIFGGVTILSYIGGKPDGTKDASEYKSILGLINNVIASERGVPCIISYVESTGKLPAVWDGSKAWILQSCLSHHPGMRAFLVDDKLKNVEPLKSVVNATGIVISRFTAKTPKCWKNRILEFFRVLKHVLPERYKTQRAFEDCLNGWLKPQPVAPPQEAQSSAHMGCPYCTYC
jgi:hypothetical protein